MNPLWEHRTRSSMIGGKVGVTRTNLPGIAKKIRLMPADSFVASTHLQAEQAVPAVARSTFIGGTMSRALRWARIRFGSPLFLLLFATLAVRIVGIDRPLTGTFATKSAVHAMVARNWALGRAPFYQPTIDLLTDHERSWHLMEWPVEAFAAAMGWKFFGGSLDAWGRGISIACSLVAVWLIYRLASRWFGPRAAQAAGFVFAFSPVSIIYGQSFLLESSLAALSLGTLAAFEQWLATRNIRLLLLAAITLGLAILTKVYMLALFAPLAAMLYFDVRRRAAEAQISLWRILGHDVALAAAVIGLVLQPVAFWYAWVFLVPHDSGPATDYHPLGRATIHGFPHPLLFSWAYYQRLATDFATVVLTPFGILLAVYGVFDSRFRRFWSLSIALGLLLFALPLKFMAANYYYLVLLPALALAAGLGWQRLLERPNFAAGSGARKIAYGLAAISFLVALRYAIGPAYRTHPEDRGVIAAAEAVRKRSQPEERVATIHGSTIDLLYYCDRPGWALDIADAKLERKLYDSQERGAKLLAVSGLDDLEQRPAVSRLLQRLALLESGDDWRLYELRFTPHEQSGRH